MSRKNILLALSFVVLILAGYFFFIFPSKEEIKGCLKTKMYDVDLCPKNSNYTPLKLISKYLQKTIISTEDGSFYSHNGFDSEGIENCLQKMKEKKRIVCGGSTITQQLAKNLFLSKNKSFLRKGLEALITIRIEETLTKKEILEKYLNVIQYGKNIFGIKQAARFYFKKSPSQLDLVESAFLAMVLPNPEKYSQSYYRKDLTRFAKKRITSIIENLYRYQHINEEEYITALARIDSFLLQGNEIPAPALDKEDISDEDLKEMNVEAE